MMRVPVAFRRDDVPSKEQLRVAHTGMSPLYSKGPDGKGPSKFVGYSDPKVIRAPVGEPAYAKIRYAKGAPMGLYALWPAFTLAHHCLCRLAYRLSTIVDFPPPEDL